MISGTPDRRRRAILWSAIVSAVLHVVVLSLLFYLFARVQMTPQGAREHLSETTTITIARQLPPPRHAARHARRERAPAPAPIRHELAREVVHAPPQAPQRPRPVVVAPIQRDQTAFANEVAQLNKQNDPHAIPTIDPASRESSSKSYSFGAGQSNNGEDRGNGIITPIRSWQDRGMDCYYARYEYSYPNGSMESATIPWPLCFDPGSDPFHLPPHPMPLPPPMTGYTLPPGTDLQPIEKAVYEDWAASNSHS